MNSLIDRSPEWRALSDALDGMLAPPRGEGRAALGDIADNAIGAVIRDYRETMNGTMSIIDSSLGKLLGDVAALRRRREGGGRAPEAVAADMQALSTALSDVRTLRQHVTEALADTNGPLVASLRHEIADALGIAVAQGNPVNLAGSPAARASARRSRDLAASVTARGGVIMSGQTAGTNGISNIHGARDANGATVYVVEGEIFKSVPRAEAPNYQNRLESARRVGLPGYERAHLWGPGFGDEAADGIMYAPRGVNQILQNLGVEGVIRQSAEQARAMGGRLLVEARAVSHPPGARGLPPGFVGDALARVEYHVVLEFPDGTRQPQYTVGIDVDTQGRFTVDAPSHDHHMVGPDSRFEVEGVELPPRPDASFGRFDPSTGRYDPAFAHPVDINQWDLDVREVKRLPGIGDALAERIVAFVRRERPITSLDRLLEIPGIGPSTIAGFEPPQGSGLPGLIDFRPANGDAR
ncbi:MULTISPECIES: polymorphic toxin type 4 domain-containing protein [unclassified Salinibacterium]|uniref:polymorphic toxin type 4 domain-containing protein n=1 Tax=unclassified Salinibacterium TaxID=2632331 RepID=UPI0018CDFF64|nr:MULTISPECIES: polymorphic toxin type 4 domain-containing protein [unclassified Salinibacterium]MBH0053126.1 helix-hairpin-helix domain-containing protein [Salinibacterium sp. SWN139]MBH0082392.1 helix-hairpin-helix domain-containing protein [Salinibacterium sp. SWN167]